jgi:hypothetical protein
MESIPQAGQGMNLRFDRYKYQAGAFDDDIEATDLLQRCKARSRPWNVSSPNRHSIWSFLKRLRKAQPSRKAAPVRPSFSASLA